MILGIDLGTTNSLGAVYMDGDVKIIPNRLGESLTPSVVSIDEDGTLYVGKTAKERGMCHPLDTAKVFKRSMGTEKDFVLGGKKYRAEELSSLVLRSLKEDAENYLDAEIHEAIISVPAYFNDKQRKATKKAGELAGFKVERIINEPTAAAIACGMADRGDEAKYIVFDLGGGTFDVSILERFGPIMEVHAVAGDNFLGGEDFTQVLGEMFLEQAAIAPESLDIRTMNDVLKEAEQCKCRFEKNSEITMECMIDGSKVSMDITLADYERACDKLLSKLRKPIERSLKDAHIALDEIDQIVLVGGATRLPIIKRFIARLFHRIPSTMVDPDEAVAVGAAMISAMKERNEEIKEVILTDVCPFTLGTDILVDNGVFEEAGHYLPIIERNTVIPVSRTETVYTAHDGQTRVNVKILQGESRMAYNNLLLGELSIPVPPGPKGTEAVDITFTYDINSLLEVIVKVHSTGVERKIVIQGGEDKLSEEEVEEKLARLQHLKQNPRDDEANKLELLRGERLYEEADIRYRSAIDRALMDFEAVLRKQDRGEIENARKKLSKLLDEIEYK